MCCQKADRSGQGGCFSSFLYMPSARPESTFRLRPLLLIKIPSRRDSSLLSRVVRRWSAELRALYAGMLWPWWFGPIESKVGSADTFQPSHRRPPYMRLHLTTSFGRRPTIDRKSVV